MGEHLFRRGKIWYGWTYDASGNQEKFSTKCSDKAAARLVLAQKERDTADPDTARKKGATLGDAFDLLLKDRKALVTAGRRSERTLAFYDSHSRPWFIFAGIQIKKIPAEMIGKLTLEERNDLAELGKKLALVDAGDERFVDALIQHRREVSTSEHTIHHDRQTFKTALGMAKRARIWSGDLSVVFAPHDTGYEPKQHWISHEDADKLLKTIILPHRRAYVAFILATGSELASRPTRFRCGTT
jgi:hypothetical protein